MTSESRPCSACGRSRDTAAFPAKGSRCLDCRRKSIRAHYLANRDYYLAKARRRQARVVEETRAWLLNYLLEHPCVDCTMSDVRVLEFDHRDDSVKVASVAVLARSGYPLAKVQEEVKKCDVRCANCHRIRTHKQRGWWGAMLTVEDSGRPLRSSMNGRARRDSNPQTF